MSQMQPPRQRTSKHRPETIQLLRSTIINVGTLAATAMMLRFAILIAVPGTDQRGLRLVRRATSALVWPFQHIPPLQRTLRGGLTVADIATLAVIILIWFIALGIVAGWEQEEHRSQRALSVIHPRP